MTTLRRCPCCNSVAITVDGVEFGDRYVGWLDGYARVSPQVGRVARILAIRAGCPVSVDEIVDWLWGEDADGGPLWARHAAKVYVHHLRQQLGPAFPGDIVTHGHRGYELVIHSREKIGVAA